MVDRSFHNKDYDTLIQSLLEFINDYPLCKVVQKAVDTLKSVMPYFDGKVSQFLLIKCEALRLKLPNNHMISTFEIPYINFQVQTYNQIRYSLVRGFPNIQETYRHITSSKYLEEMDSVHSNWMITLQTVAPNYAQTLFHTQQLLHF